MSRDVLDHVVGVGGGAAGDEPAERAVDQRREVSPEVWEQAETLETSLRRETDAETQRETAPPAVNKLLTEQVRTNGKFIPVRGQTGQQRPQTLHWFPLRSLSDGRGDNIYHLKAGGREDHDSDRSHAANSAPFIRSHLRS